MNIEYEIEQLQNDQETTEKTIEEMREEIQTLKKDNEHIYIVMESLKDILNMVANGKVESIIDNVVNLRK